MWVATQPPPEFTNTKSATASFTDCVYMQILVGLRHRADDCRFKKEICHKCKPRGHIKAACKNQRKTEKNKEPVHAVGQESGSDSDDAFIGTIEGTNILWVMPEIENTPLKMELDTGSAVSIIPVSTYEKLFKTKKLTKTDTVLKTYSGEKLCPRRLLQVHVKYGRGTQTLPLYVVKGNGPPLLGRDWLSHMKLNWNEIKLLRTTKSTETKTHKRLEQILKKYEAFF